MTGKHRIFKQKLRIFLKQIFIKLYLCKLRKKNLYIIVNSIGRISHLFCEKRLIFTLCLVYINVKDVKKIK